MIVSEGEDRAFYDLIQEKNLSRQYDLLTNCVEIGIRQGYTAFDKYTLWALNHVAVANISQFGGRFREEPIYVGNHLPPHFNDIPELMDRFISTIHENWFNWTSTEIAAYGLWRLNWIHPFIEGNGRTARATCYYLICAKRVVCCQAKRFCQSAFARIAPDTWQVFGQPIARGRTATSTFQSSRPISPVYLRRS